VAQLLFKWWKKRIYVLMLQAGNDWQQILLLLELAIADPDMMVIIVLVNALQHTY
jgi:hypothetical protein